jgi:two-component system cell cycle sensor histidine kinase/response regulator CckA
VANLMKMLQRILGEQINMELCLSPRALVVHADAGMLEQVLLNLAVNARDAMSSGGRLVIETTEEEFDPSMAQTMPDVRPGSFACLSVSDTGSGIAKEILPRVFEPFFTTKEVGKGTGLGLATVFGIVKQHGGWITVYSEPGQGTTFRVYLPRSASAADAAARPENPVAARGGDETILVAEDDTALRTMVHAVLSDLGYEVLDAPSGVAALEVWSQRRADIRLLLTELVMPGGMSGMALARQLRAEEPRLRVIYTSGYSAEVAGKHLESAAGTQYIAKPFDLHRLARMIRDELDATDVGGPDVTAEARNARRPAA